MKKNEHFYSYKLVKDHYPENEEVRVEMSKFNFIDDLLSMTSEAETPESFIKWSGYASISAILKRNVFLNKFYYTVYPNIYVLFIADSGLAKGFSNVIASRLVDSIGNTRVISGRNSIQGILKDLATATTSDNGKPPILDACCFLNSGEFVNFLLQDDQAVSILTELYDSNYIQKYTSTLKSTGKETLKNPYVVLLGSSNETLLKEALPESSVEGGFIARTILVREEKKRTINPLTRKPLKTIDFSIFTPYLKEVAELRGEFTYTTAARDYYEEWYKEFAQRDYQDRTGSSNRLHDTILKLSIIISASRRLDKKLELTDVQDAIKELVEAKSKERGLFLVSNSKSELATKTRSVLSTLLRLTKVSRVKLLQANYGIVNAEDLDKVIDNLTQAKFVRSVKEDKELYYELTDTAKERVKKGTN